MNVIVEAINAAGRAFVGFALPMLVQTSLLVVILLLVDLVLRRRVRAVFRYWVWMLVLVKLVLPPSLWSPVSIGTWFGDTLTTPTVALLELEEPESAVPPAVAAEPPSTALSILSQAPPLFRAPATPYSHDVAADIPPVPVEDAGSSGGRVDMTEAPAGIDTPTPPARPLAVALSWRGLVLLGWAAVATALLLLLLQRVFFVRGLIAQVQEADAAMQEVLEECRGRIGLRSSLAIKVSPNASSPAVCGLVRPVILVPQGLAPKLEEADLRAVLLHELAHVKRGDLWINLVQTLLQIAYFYNPFLWLANAMICRTREQAVDEAVLVAMGETAQQYPETLLNVARLAFTRRPALSLRLIGVVESKSALTSRIKHMLSRPLPRTARLGLLGLTVIVLIAAVLLPMAKGQEQDVLSRLAILPNCGVWMADIAGQDLPVLDLASERIIEFPVVEKEYDLLQRTSSERRGDILYYYDKAKHAAKITFLRSAGLHGEPPSDEYETLTVTPMRMPFETTLTARDGDRFKIGIVRADAEACSIRFRPLAGGRDKFRAVLPDNVTVELVGVCEYPSEGRQWWGPDGETLREVPCIRNPRDKVGFVASDERVYEIAFRFGRTDELDFQWHAEGTSGHMVAVPHDPSTGAMSPQMRLFVAHFPKTQRTAQIQIDITRQSDGTSQAGWQQSIQFEGISLRPSQKTDVQISASTRDEPGSQTGGDLTFGPVMEREFGLEPWIDLDRNYATRPPEWLVRNETTEAVLKWFRDEGIDAVAERSPKILGLGCIDLVAVELNEGAWTRFSARQLQEALRSGDIVEPVPESGLQVVYLRGTGSLPATYGFRTREGTPGILQSLGISATSGGLKIRYKLLQDVSGPEADVGVRATPGALDSRRVHLPDLETPDANVVLDLATGQLLSGEPMQRDSYHFAKLGKGDIAYEHAQNKSGLLCLRGARMQHRTGTGLEPLPPDVARESFVVYFIGSTPARYQVTTAEGRQYEIEVFSADDTACTFTYSHIPADRGPGGGALVQPGAKLPNGVTVRFLAYSQLTGDGLTWRTSAGKSTTVPGVHEADIEGLGTVLAFQTEPAVYTLYAWLFQPPDKSESLENKWRLNDSNIWLVALGEADTYANIDIQAVVADAPVVRPVVLKKEGMGDRIAVGEYGISEISDLTAIGSDSSRFSVHRDLPGPRVVAAVDSSGNLHPLRVLLPPVRPGGAQSLFTASYEVDLPVDRLASVVVEGYSERGARVSFRNVSVNPSRPTAIRVEATPEQQGPWWRESPHYSNIERLGKSLWRYAETHAGQYPARVSALKDAMSETEWQWLEQHVVYLGTGRSSTQEVATPLAYDKTLLPQGKGTYVVYADHRIQFESPAQLKDLGITAAKPSEAKSGSLANRTNVVNASLALCITPKGDDLENPLVEYYERVLLAGRSSPHDEYAWFEVRPHVLLQPNGVAREVVTGDQKGKMYLLLSTSEPDVMAAGDDWAIEHVEATTDAMDRPAIRVWLDARGAERLFALTQANVNKALAILVDGRVASVHMITHPVRDQVVIAGNFTERERQQMVDFLRVETIARRVTPRTAGHEATLSDAPRPQPAPDAKHNMLQLGLGVVLYANEHDGELPPTLAPLEPYVGDAQAFAWLRENVIYAARANLKDYSGPDSIITICKTARKASPPIDDRYVVFLDGHAGVADPQWINELGLEDMRQSLPQVSPEPAERSMTPTFSSKGVTVKLANGITATLLALFSGYNVNELQWWYPDGTPVPPERGAEFREHMSGAMLLRPQRGYLQPCDFGYLLQVSGPEDMTVRTGLSVKASTIPGFRLKAVAGPYATLVWRDELPGDPPLPEAMDIKVVAASGPYRTVESDYDSERGYLRLQDGDYRFMISSSLSRMGLQHDYIDITADRDDVDIDLSYHDADADYRNARPILPFPAHEGPGPLFTWRLRPGGRAIPPEHIFLDYRPAKVAVFRGVSLRPGHKTSVEVEARPPALVSSAPPGPGPLARHALSFDGVDDRLIVPPSPSLTLKPPFTIEVWLKPDPEKELHRMSLLQKGRQPTDPEKIQEGGFFVCGGRPRSSKRACWGTLVLGRSDGRVWQGDAFGADTVLDQPGWGCSLTRCTDNDYVPVPDQPLLIGNDFVGEKVPLKGEIAEIRIWNKGLTDGEAFWYEAGSLTGNEPNLVACWDFERQPGGQIVYDISPNANHAYLGTSEAEDSADPKWVDLSSEPQAAPVAEEKERVVEPGETVPRETVKHNMLQLGLAVVLYANDHNGELPATLVPLEPYVADARAFAWLKDNVIYTGKGNVKDYPAPYSTVVACEAAQKASPPADERYVLFLDAHVELAGPARLKELHLEEMSQPPPEVSPEVVEQGSSEQPGDTLQRLIDQAQAGGTVVVPKGRYTEPIEITRPVVLRGESQEECVIEVTADRPAVLIDTKGQGQVTVENVTIRWQLATSGRTERPVALMVKDSEAVVRNCRFEPLGNYQRSPVAVQIDGFSEATVDNCRFNGFEYTVCYGPGTKGVVQDCVITNSGHQGVINYEGATLTVQRCIITGSKFHAVRCTGGTLNVKDNLLVKNANRGIYLGNKSGRGSIMNNLILGNGTGISGFALAGYVVANNVIVDNGYAGIDMRDSCRLDIHNNILAKNQRGAMLFKEGERNYNTLGENVYWSNATDIENFDKPADPIKADPQFADPNSGDFSVQGPAEARGHGLTDPRIIMQLWQKYERLQSEGSDASDAGIDAASAAVSHVMFGRVLDPAGRPADGAQVAFVGPTVARARADAQGRFQIEGEPDEASALVAMHDAGFVGMRAVDFVKTRELRLESWDVWHRARISAAWPDDERLRAILPKLAPESSAPSGTTVEPGASGAVDEAADTPGVIQQRIDEAAPGATVRLEAGVYKERLVINKPLTLEGAGWDKTVVMIEKENYPSIEEVQRIVMERVAKAQSDAERQRIAEEAKAEFVQKLSPVMLSVENAQGVVVRGIKFSSPGGHVKGASVSLPVVSIDHSRVNVKDCALLAGPGNGIHIKDGSDVQIDRTLVAAVWGTGIGVTSEKEPSRAHIHDSDIRNCHYAGIRVAGGGAEAVIERCRISGAAWHGVRYDDVSPTLQGNLIFGNARSGIYASGKTTAIVKNNLLYDNEMTGMSCWFQNKDVIEGNTFANNERSGLEILGASKPVITRNIFYSNPTGVHLGDVASKSPFAQSDGQVALEGNLFWANENNVLWWKSGDAKRTIELDEKTGVVADPQFTAPSAGDFSLPVDSPARPKGIGATGQVPLQSPWPLQPEELAIIPKADTRDSEQWRHPD